MWPPGHASHAQTANKRTDRRGAPAGLLAMTKIGKRFPPPCHSEERSDVGSVTPSLRPQPPPRGGTEPAPYRPTESPQRTPPVTVPPPTPGGGIPKEGAAAPCLWAFQRGARGGNSQSPRNLSSGLWGCILLIRKEYIPSCRRSSPVSPVASRPAAAGCGHPALRRARKIGQAPTRA